jgi:hypothetical protein
MRRGPFTQRLGFLTGLALFFSAAGGWADEPLGPAFTYQGHLQRSGVPVNGICDLELTLYDAPAGGFALGTQLVESLAVHSGRFTALLNEQQQFAGAFRGSRRWLEIAVRCPAGSGGFTLLEPRQELTAAPHALFSLGTPWSGLTGIPPGFADGIDDGTVFVAGDGLLLSDGVLRVVFGGSGTAVTAARSDHGHADFLRSDRSDIFTAGTLSFAPGTTLRLDGAIDAAAAASVSFPADSITDAMISDVLTLDGGTIRNSTIDGSAIGQTTPAAGRFSSLAVSSGVITLPDGETIANVSNAIIFTDNAGAGDSFQINMAPSQSVELKVNGIRALRIEPKSASPNLVGGSIGNAAIAGVVGASIAGGGSTDSPNKVYDSYGTIGGGENNQAGVPDGVVQLQGHATVGGGYSNSAINVYATVGGGLYNTTTGFASAVGGGLYNHASGYASAVGGGEWNWGDGYLAAVGGGGDNRAYGFGAVIGGGQGNAADGFYAVIGGGGSNSASEGTGFITVAGGGLNQATASVSVISGGFGNTADGYAAAIGGGTNNQATGDSAAIGGGGGNQASGPNTTVSGGVGNRALGTNAALGGGAGNEASGVTATIAGGGGNQASGDTSTIGGGGGNQATGPSATVSGGGGNHATGGYAAIGGGQLNRAAGNNAAVPGGVGASAALHGQVAHAAGTFQEAGDAQGSVYVLRNQTEDAAVTPLFLDGAAERLVIADGRAMMFDVLVVARAQDGRSAGYRAQAMAESTAGTLSLIPAVPSVLELEPADADWTVAIEVADDALLVQVTGEADASIRWVATVRTAEVSFPAP